ncbi:aspartoacylase [Gynuella sp.]|uniref:aspartoacylase n=1 Tax=Gynuella sp. TaxID=2969146 RepID=UPI003D117053
MDSIKSVVIVGGTHGNELTGIHLLRRWEQKPQEINRGSFVTETLLANPRAHAMNCRYIDQDLNRQFAIQDLANPTLPGYEQNRAKAINQLIGPKQDPARDFIIDLHTTTANMGITIVINSLNPIVRRAAVQVQKTVPNVTLFYQEVDRMEDNFMISIARIGGLIIEVGPVAQGCLRADIFEASRLATHAVLDYLHLTNIGKAPELPETASGFQFVKKVKMPEDEQGNLIGMIHPNVQDKDFQPLNPGDPLFLLQNGDTVFYQDEPGLCPAFVNEAAYYDQHHGLSLLKRIEFEV